MSLYDLLAVYKELTKAQNNLIDEGRYSSGLQNLIIDYINIINKSDGWYSDC